MSNAEIEIPEKFKEIPSEHMVFDKEMNKWLPKIGGLMYLADKCGVMNYGCDVVMAEPMGFAVVKARAELIPTYDYYLSRMGQKDSEENKIRFKEFMYAKGSFYSEGAGECNAENVSLDFAPFMVAFAETRALSRALKKLLGISDVIYEEMKLEKLIDKSTISSKGYTPKAKVDISSFNKPATPEWPTAVGRPTLPMNTSKDQANSPKEDKDSREHLLTQIMTFYEFPEGGEDKASKELIKKKIRLLGVKSLEQVPTPALQDLLNKLHSGRSL